MRKPKEQIRGYKGYIVRYCPENPEQHRWSAGKIKDVLCWQVLQARYHAHTLKELKTKINGGDGCL